MQPHLSKLALAITLATALHTFICRVAAIDVA